MDAPRLSVVLPQGKYNFQLLHPVSRKILYKSKVIDTSQENKLVIYVGFSFKDRETYNKDIKNGAPKGIPGIIGNLTRKR